MNRHIEDFKRLSARMKGEKGQRYTDTKMYLNSIMRAMNQEELIDTLKLLNYHELKTVMAAGVPGHAMHIANQLLENMKVEIKAYIEKKGAEASATVEIDQDEEVKEDVVEGIRPSEKRREGDSGEMGETNTNSGA